MTGDREKTAGERIEDEAAFVFGVSGHRDLVPADLTVLRKELGDIFRRCMSARPHAAFQLLTPLAEGADRIAADEALSLGIQLVVPMPMAQSEYERDFVTAESLAEFRRLLKLAEKRIEMPDAALVSEGEDRTQCYAAVGDYIARNSHLLILLWDGQDNQKVGGTAWVKMRREHWTRVATESHQTPALETVHVLTRRATT